MARKLLRTPGEAWGIVQEVFRRLRACRSVADVDRLCNEHDPICRFRMEPEKYPKLNFSLTPGEVERLRVEGWLHDDYSLNHNRLGGDEVHPVIKLLYAQAWKNGDLGKVRHIVRGVAESGDAECNCESAFVFYQFGAHLANREVEPIIDQHVLRAFGIFRTEENDTARIQKLQNLGQLRKTHQPLIDDYKSWIADPPELSAELRAEAGFRYAVDQLLFAVGRAVR